MSRITPSDAKARRAVRLPDGRVATLFSLPAAGWKQGTRARVRLTSGTFLSVDPASLTLIEAA